MTSTPWTSVSPGIGLGSSELITLVDGNTFFVGHASGDLFGEGVEGLFMLDTRVLARWRLTIDGHAVEAVSSVPNGPFSVSLVGRTASADHADSDITVVRRRHLGRGMREDLEVRYHGLERRTLTVALEVASDFASLFEVKAGHVADPTMAAGELEDGRLVVRPAAATVVDALLVSFHPAPDGGRAGLVWWEVVLEPGEIFALCAEVGARAGGDVVRPSHRCGEPVETAIPVNRLARWRSTVPRITSDDPALERAVAQALEDLGALRIFDPDHAERVVVAAGAPWFMTLFGRDALLTAWMALIVDHQLTNGVLAALADTQGRTSSPETEEEPGRILHEVRYDHHSARLLGGRNIYYGTIDATPLFVMLVAELARWTGTAESVAALIPAVDRAMTWIERFGDRDGDGYVEYARTGQAGLANQGWKDSWDGVRHADGRLAEAPIALCEVQGYVYAAHLGRADLADLMGDPVTAARHRAAAVELRNRFDRDFWLPDAGTYAIGLDRDKAPIDSLTSNVGHCLWTGIVPAERSADVARLLASDRLFSGWGLRTLAVGTGGYNPLSYHCGSVWPHDTALAVAGLARSGHDEAAGRLARGLIDAAAAGGGRLPELFAGFDRGDLTAPIPYPASCSPQAWAAASPLLVARSILGFEPDLVNRTVRLRPRFPPGISRLAVDGLPLGGGRVSITADVDGVEVTGLPDGVELLVS